MAALRIAAFLALREQRADLRTTACYALAFAAMLAPLLTLLALKEGIVDNMTRQLLDDPSMLEVLPVGSAQLDNGFFERIEALPESGFVTPRTRTISARLLGLRNEENRKLIRGPALVPTGPRDPVTAHPAPSFDAYEVILSAEAARLLGAEAGTQLAGWVERRRGDTQEVARIALTVSAIAPAENDGRVAIFAPLQLLLAVENFLDGHGAAGDRWVETALSHERDTFASFRIYARSVHDVLALRDAVAAEGVRARVRSDKIVTVLKINAALDWLFAVIAGVAGGGFLLSLAASLRSNVERLRPTLSMFRLLGAGAATRFLIPVAQSAIIVGAGGAMALVGFALIAVLIEYRAADLLDGASILRLTPTTLLALVLALGLGAILAALMAGRDAVRIGPEVIVRRV